MTTASWAVLCVWFWIFGFVLGKTKAESQMTNSAIEPATDEEIDFAEKALVVVYGGGPPPTPTPEQRLIARVRADAAKIKELEDELADAYGNVRFWKAACPPGSGKPNEQLAKGDRVSGPRGISVHEYRRPR